jgi:hypothetical protein
MHQEEGFKLFLNTKNIKALPLDPAYLALKCSVTNQSTLHGLCYITSDINISKHITN